MICSPSSSGRMAASSSASISRAMRASRSSYVRASRAALRALRVVESDRVSLCRREQQRAGVGDVPADGRVGPLARAVAVEAQVQLDQPRHRLHRVLVVAQRLQPLRRELGADDLVVVERHAAARLEAPRGRLADVVQQRGEPQHQVGAGHVVVLEVDRLLEHRQGVLVDVLVPVVLVALEPQGGQLGQDDVGQPGVDEQRQADGAGGRRSTSFVQLVAHPLGRDDRRAARPCRASPPRPRAPPRTPAGRRTAPRAACAGGRR